MSFQICRQRRARACRRLDRSSVFAWACGGAVFLLAKKRTRIAGAASALRAQTFCPRGRGISAGGRALECFGAVKICLPAEVRRRCFEAQKVFCALNGLPRAQRRRFGRGLFACKMARWLAEKGGRRQIEKARRKSRETRRKGRRQEEGLAEKDRGEGRFSATGNIRRGRDLAECAACGGANI